MTTIRVLIVDDMPEVRQELRTILTLAGNICRDKAEDGIAVINDGTSRAPAADGEDSFEIEIVGEAVNGLEAIDLANTLHPDVIVMDLEMPVMDGYEAARQIKAFYPDCRVIALTVHGYEDARQKAHQAGVDFFIVKGAPVEVLVQAISRRSVKNLSEK